MREPGTLQPEIKAQSAIVEDMRSCCQVCMFWSNSIVSTATLGTNMTGTRLRWNCIIIILATLEILNTGIRRLITK